jgi:hypothetical protein
MKYVDDYNATIEYAKKETRIETRKETLAEVFSLLRRGYSIDDAERMLSVKA